MTFDQRAYQDLGEAHRFGHTSGIAYHSLVWAWSPIAYEREDPIPVSDFEWFTSGDLDTSAYKGLTIAVFGKKVIGYGRTSVDAYKMAKKNNPTAEPAITFIPETEDSIY